MKRVLRATAAMQRRATAEMLQYRGEVALWAIWGVIYPAVALAMWNAAAEGAGGAIHGYDAGAFAAYFFLTMIAGHLTTAWDVHEMGWRVRSGALSPALLRPLLPMCTSIAENVSYKLVTLIILAPLWAAAMWIMQPRFEGGGLELLAGLAALLLGAALHYVWQYTLALIAFWSTRTNAVAEFWFGGTLLFGGRMAPLALLPGPLQWVAAALPFKWIIWFPVAVALGRLDAAGIASGLAWQVGWLAAGIVLFRIFWAASVKRYAAVGA